MSRAFRLRALAPAKVSWQNETRLRFAIKAPARGQIEHMCQAVGLSVISMRRLRIGRLSLASLPVGLSWVKLQGRLKRDGRIDQLPTSR